MTTFALAWCSPAKTRPRPAGRYEMIPPQAGGIAEQIAAPVAGYVFPADTIFFGNLSIRAFTYPMA